MEHSADVAAVQTGAVSMLHILAARHPLEVGEAGVGLNAVFVVDLLTSGVARQERFCGEVAIGVEVARQAL